MKNYNVKEILKSDQALAFSNYLKKLNNDLTFEIIFPKKLWPNIEKEQPDEAMQYINQHHKVFQDSTENDFGIDYILGASTSADCWIHIKKGKDEIVGYATNVFYKINSQKVNFFRVTFFKQSIRQLKIYPYLQDLRINIFPSDFIFSRTQNPVVYKIFSRFFKLYGLKIAPSLNGFDSKCIKVARSLGFDVDDNLIIKNAVRGIVAKNTPFIEGEIDTLWKKIDLNNGDVYLVVGYK